MFDSSLVAAIILVFELTVAGGSVESPLSLMVFENAALVGHWESAAVDAGGASMLPALPRSADERGHLELQWGRVAGESSLYAVSAGTPGDGVESVGAVSLRRVIDALYDGQPGEIFIAKNLIPVAATESRTVDSSEIESVADSLETPLPGFQLYQTGSTVFCVDREFQRIILCTRTER